MLHHRQARERSALVRSSCTVVCVSVLLLSAAADAQRAGEPRRRGPTNRDRSSAQMLNEEGFPLNVDPEIVSAEDAPIDDGDMVMGIVHNGEARAYPVNYMNGPLNEVVNDRLGGTAIAPSW